MFSASRGALSSFKARETTVKSVHIDIFTSGPTKLKAFTWSDGLAAITNANEGKSMLAVFIGRMLGYAAWLLPLGIKLVDAEG
jgi:hypothetical protein